MFLHGVGSTAGNMLFLWIFGNNVEDRLGYVVYPLFYVLGGLAASALQLVFGANSTIPNLGASGAIGGILGAYIVLFPHARVLTLIIFFITWVEILAGVVLAIWFVIQLFSGVGELGADGRRGGVLGARRGFAFGALVAWLFYRRPVGRGRRRTASDRALWAVMSFPISSEAWTPVRSCSRLGSGPGSRSASWPGDRGASGGDLTHRARRWCRPERRRSIASCEPAAGTSGWSSGPGQAWTEA